MRAPALMGLTLGSGPLAQDLIHLGPANLWDWRWCDIPGQAALLLDCLHGEKGFPHICSESFFFSFERLL